MSNRPDYAALKCPVCGNAKDFVEFSLRETKQPFALKDGEPDWDLYEALDTADISLSIDCGECEAEVWVNQDDPRIRKVKADSELLDALHGLIVAWESNGVIEEDDIEHARVVWRFAAGQMEEGDEPGGPGGE